MHSYNSILVFDIEDIADISNCEELYDDNSSGAFVILINRFNLPLSNKLKSAGAIRRDRFSSNHDLVMSVWSLMYGQDCDFTKLKILNYPISLEFEDLLGLSNNLTKLFSLLGSIEKSLIVEYGLAQKISALVEEIDNLDSLYWRRKLRTFMALCQAIVDGVGEISQGVSLKASDSIKLSPTFFATKLKNFKIEIKNEAFFDNKLVEQSYRDNLSLFEKRIKKIANDTDAALRRRNRADPDLYLLYAFVLGMPDNDSLLQNNSLNLIHLSRQIEMLSTYIAITRNIVVYNEDKNEFRFKDDGKLMSGVGRLVNKLRKAGLISQVDLESIREILRLRNNLIETHGFGRFKDELNSLKNKNVISTLKRQINNQLYENIQRDLRELSVQKLVSQFVSNI